MTLATLPIASNTSSSRSAIVSRRCHLPSGVAERAEACRYGGVFDEIADEYDCHRPAYLDALIDRAYEVARLTPGARVLEIGCGTGQLTYSLLARRLRVVAVEPGDELIARARNQLVGAGEVQFVNARLEEASVPRRTTERCFRRPRSIGSIRM